LYTDDDIGDDKGVKVEGPHTHEKKRTTSSLMKPPANVARIYKRRAKTMPETPKIGHRAAVINGPVLSSGGSSILKDVQMPTLRTLCDRTFHGERR
jgi:hypothetical protein